MLVYISSLTTGFVLIRRWVHPSRTTKTEKVLEELKVLVDGQSGTNMVDSLYKRSIEEVTNKINHLNGSYSDELCRSVKNKDMSDSYSEKIRGVVKDICEKRELIKKLDDEITELALQVNVENKDLLLKYVEGRDDISSSFVK